MRPGNLIGFKKLSNLKFYFRVFLLTLPVKLFAGVGMHGPVIISGTNVIVNEYTTLTANVSSGSYTITVASSTLNDNGRFSGDLAAGELIMIVQMQGASLNTSSTLTSAWGTINAYNNTGKMELNEVVSTPDANTITFANPLTNSYTSSGRVQVIRVPRYDWFQLDAGASVIAPAWDGSTGGVIAVESNLFTYIHGTMDVSGKGFRGGIVDSTSNSNHVIFASPNKGYGAEKGEGIGGDRFKYDTMGGRYGRGAPANGGGGGNSHNGGGGGGSNGGDIASWNGLGNPDTITNINWKTAWDLEGVNFHANVSSGGGRGGYTFSFQTNNPMTTAPGNTLWIGDNRFNVGGYGGRPLDNTANRVFFGGGGGAGDSNNNTGSGGANGGGMVCIFAGGPVSGTGVINANGADALNSTGLDAAGGGGGGGTVFIYSANSSVSNLTINAKGGKGGNQVRPTFGTGEAEGPGGGGGGGQIQISNPVSLTTNNNGGKHGTTNSPAMVSFLPNGATMGFTGSTTPPFDPYSVVTPLPISLLSFNGKIVGKQVYLSWTTATEINNNYFTIEKSSDGRNYSRIGIVQGAGTSNTILDYELIDENPFQGNNYYKLSQTDFDGTTVSFTPICLKFNSQIGSFHVESYGPNPFSENIVLNFASDRQGLVKLTVINNLGAIIRTKTITLEKGISSYIFSDLSNLASGLYTIQCVFENKEREAVRVSKK